MTSVELRVIVSVSDERADQIETQVRLALSVLYARHEFYVDRVIPHT
jgi:hypothetical protein